MTETATQRAEAMIRTMEATAGSDDLQARAMAFLVGGPTQGTSDALWKIVVKGLMFVLVLGVVGLAVMIGLGKNSDALLTVITATLTGLVGLFVPSPK